MKRFLALSLVACASLTMFAQSTARKFVLKNSADGKSELTCYLPQNPSGRAVVDCPGGGYSHLAMEHEGHQWAEYFNKQGIAYFVLKYRMPNGDRNIPLGDAYQAMRTVRDSAAVWHINKEDVGIMGFSAGGHLASSVSTHAEYDVRPNFSILFYPVISMDERITHKGSCVNFLGEERKTNPQLVKEWSNDKAVRRQQGVCKPRGTYRLAWHRFTVTIYKRCGSQVWRSLHRGKGGQIQEFHRNIYRG